jgi:hypothetical protein
MEERRKRKRVMEKVAKALIAPRLGGDFHSMWN